MKSILLSFSPDWFEKLSNGELKFEYRKNIPEGPVLVYFYVSRPIKAIMGVAHFGKREMLEDWISKYGGRSENVRQRILEYMEDCRYASPIYSFQMIQPILLSQMQQAFSNFVVPRMYYYLNGDLLRYIEQNCIPIGQPIINTFEELLDEDIC